LCKVQVTFNRMQAETNHELCSRRWDFQASGAIDAISFTPSPST